jgi:alpha-N-arabinofuranosidase
MKFTNPIRVVRRGILGAVATTSLFFAQIDVTWASPLDFLARKLGRDDTQALLTVSGEEIRPSLPSHFISFNMNFITFEMNYWDTTRGKVKAEVVEGMRAFSGAIYRYPGGLISNAFDWEGAVGDVASRRRQKTVSWKEGTVARFGPEEYFAFLDQVGGQSWYVLNLLGWDEQALYRESSSAKLAASNQKLAEFRRVRDKTSGIPRFYHLGNELDRSEYQWPTEKYVQRSLESLNAVRQADPDARFVPFLRDFDWHYRGRPGTSPAKDFANDVLTGLPGIEDFSLQVYYDRPSEEGKTFDVEWRQGLLKRIIAQTTALRGKPYRVWITEHAKQNPQKAPLPYRLATTSGITGAVASADFLIAMTQLPEIQGVFWHALGGGHWWDLFREADGRVEPTPVYWAFRLLRENMTGAVLKTDTAGPNESRYEGGYDVRSVVLSKPGGNLTVWAINRAGKPTELSLSLKALKGRRVSIRHGYVAASKPGGGLESEMDIIRESGDPPREARFSDKGVLRFTLPALSVSALRIEQL